MKKLIVAVVVIWALVIAGGVGVGAILLLNENDDEPDASEPTTSASTDQPPTGPVEDDVPPELAEFYAQEIAWEACGANDCATLEVPIDYTDPGAGTTAIALERAPATGERVGSLVVNPGGPGAPGTDVAENASGYFQGELLSAYDVIGFDPRGTGESDPLDCLSDEELDEYVASDPDPDNRREGREYQQTQEEFWEGCLDSSGELVAHVSTVEAARDMDVLRAALGEDQLRYLGFSYGTELGATYADLFPGKVGRFVLDGAIDPSLSALEGSLSQAAGFETALRAYVDDCLSDDCFLGDTMEESLATITGLLGQIEQEPLPTDQDRDLAIGNAFYGLVLPLYSESNWQLLDQGLQEALEGDGSTLLFLSDFYGSREGDTYTDNSLEAISVINCTDDPFAITAAEVPGHYDEFQEASPTFGRVFAWGLIACHGIPWEAAEPAPEIDAPGAAPIVVIGTTRDPATPYEEAVAMAEQLESGVLVSRDGDGHTAYNSGNDCIDDAVHAYLIDGEVPQDGLEC